MESTKPPLRDRKAEHIELALDRQMQIEARAFEAWDFTHNALPECSMDSLDLSVPFLSKTLKAPLLISCMTGGTDEAEQINRRLASAAETFGVAFGVGSQRKALEDPETLKSFKVRQYAPTIPLLANLGAVQLNYGFGIDECRRAVDQIEADALVFHLNPLQEAIQPEGQTNFAGLLEKMAKVADQMHVPVLVKEIGCGISKTVGQRLLDHGFQWIDTAGMGGTSWARIEAARSDDASLGNRFGSWGISTPESLNALRDLPGIKLIGSGGLRDGIDVAKAIALGAQLAGLAYPFLKAAKISTKAVETTLNRSIEELKICMFCTGTRTIPELRRAPLRRRGIGDHHL